MKQLHLLMIAAVCLLTASCHTQKSPMTYFMDIDEMPAEMPIGDYSTKIEPSDELYITVTSSNPEASAVFNAPATNPATQSELVGNSTPRELTYTVDPKGDIIFPVLGKIHVQGMTVTELRDYITEKVSAQVTDPVVFVQIVNYRISVAGEVMRPGHYWVASPRYSILDAISQAGDLTQYGERNSVLLIREENGVRKHVRFNLNSAEIFTSPYFFLKPNDYIYVEPNKVRKDNSEYNQYNSYKLQVATTITSASAAIISLIIALSK